MAGGRLVAVVSVADGNMCIWRRHKLESTISAT